MTPDGEHFNRDVLGWVSKAPWARGEELTEGKKIKETMTSREQNFEGEETKM